MKIIYENIYVKYVQAAKTGPPTWRLVTYPGQGFTCNFVDFDATVTNGLVEKQCYICTIQPKESESHLKYPSYELISELTPTETPSPHDCQVVGSRIEAQFKPSVAE